ncbi:uncharacterized protein LOC107992708 [Apis cerana]|uniref:uncharacterized protein LOC107992708 n=1 Tax=Apis cerana TaxID=7461 RepID=UPI0007E2CE70|nr:uncharacterized protein LOC107992708 [Apis cerana]
MKGLSKNGHEWPTQLSFIVILLRYDALATIDVNLNELEYLAARLNHFECRRLIAALHYTTYELPRDLAGAERNVDESIPCIRHLVHWNSAPAEGKGTTHEILTHRLRQLGRDDLADWLGKSTFKQLGKDLQRAMVTTFEELGKQETELPHPVTLEPRKREKEDPWLQIDVILIAILLALLGTLLTLICATVIQRIRHKIKYKKVKQQENENVKQNKKKTKKKYAESTTSGTTDYIYLESDSDTDV